MKVDPRIYNAPEFQGPAIASPAELEQPQYEPPVRVSQGGVLEGSLGQAIGEQRLQEANRERAGALASMGAVISEWSPRRAYDYVTAPEFEPDVNWSAGTVLPSMRMTLSEAEREFLLATNSQKEFDWKLATVERQRAAAQAAGDSPFLSFLASVLDPGYLAIDVASLGAGRFVRLAGAGRAAQAGGTALTAGAATYGYGLAEQQVAAVSDTEIITNALLNGAAAGLFYSTGGLRRVDPEYPSEVLTELANAGRIRNPDRLNPARPHEFEASVALRSGTELAEHLRTLLAGTEYESLVEAIYKSPDVAAIRVTTDEAFGAKVPGASGFFDRNRNLVYIRSGADQNTALHELVHATVEKRMLADPALREELLGMRDQVVRTLNARFDDKAVFWSKVFDKPEEFVTYALTSPEFRKWAKDQKIGASGRSGLTSDADLTSPPMPTLPTASLWDKVLDFVAKVLRVDGPSKRAMRKFLSEREFATNPANATFKSLDDRLQEMVQRVANQSPNLYTRGTLKGIDASMDSAEVAKRIDRNVSKQVGSKISWSLHKSLARFSPKAQEVADILVDNPLDMTGDSVVSQARAVRADLSGLQFQYEDLMKAELARRGAGLRKRIFQPRKALEVQHKVEREVAFELLARERNGRLGISTATNSSKEVKAMADALDKVYKAALDEMKAAGVKGAEEVAESSGYFSRKWNVEHIESAYTRLRENGYDEAGAKLVVERIMTQGLRRANGWDAELSSSVGKAIIDRAIRKGYMEDSAFRAHAGNEAAKEIRDQLKTLGVKPQDIDRVMGVVTGVVDEAGKMSSLKHRVDIDMKAGISLPDGTVLTVADLLDTNLTRMTESYLDQASGRIALARKGIPDTSDVNKLRDDLMRSIQSQSDRVEAAYLFDNTLNSILGRPVGEDLPELLRNSQAVTRMIGLSSSGLWQTTEYSTAMARYGALKTLKYMAKEANFGNLRKSIRKDRRASSDLKEILARNAAQDVRIRPFVNRLEDNFDVPPSAVVQSALLQAQQLVPYINAQKLIQTHQARVVANLVVDTFRKAASGNADAVRALQGYGLELPILDKHKAALAEAGMDTSKWPDGLWADVRGPLTKMMDDSVLRNRTGEIPAFAQFSQVGKFIFTFRSFVLGAHNKVLAGTISRDGFAGISLLMLYQFPLVLLATEANSVIQGKPIKDEQELVSKAFGQMGSLGLFSELFGVVTGTKQQFGAPGLITIDRLYKLGGDVFSGDVGQAAAGAIQATPILSIIPGTRAIGEALKE